MEQSARIVIVGDLFPVSSNFDLFAKGDIEALFGDRIADIFKKADFRICNVEGALTDCGEKCEKTGPVISAPSSTVRTFCDLGIDLCMLANNHITDACHQGVKDTLETLDANGLKHIGAGLSANDIVRSAVVDIKGRKVGFYNVAETMYNAPSVDKGGAWLYDEYLVCRELASLKEKCECLIVIYHGGIEKFRYPSPETRKRFHRMADSGADIIISQHTHCIGCEEYYNGSYLQYGQGNFLFRSFNNEFTDTGLILEFTIGRNGFSVGRHIVRAVDDKVRYDDNQDFSAYEERSSKVGDLAFVNGEFRKFCDGEVINYIKSYKGHIPFQRIWWRFMPQSLNRYRLRSYEKVQLMFTLHSLRSEQNRETAIEGIKSLLEKGSYK